MSGLEILVETVPFGNELLFPLPKPCLLLLDLLRKPLAQILFLLLELGIVELSGASLAKLAGLHLGCTVSFVVLLFSGVDEVEHVGANEDAPEFLEITVVLVLDFSDTPSVLAALDDATIRSLHVLLATNNRERHSSHQTASVRSSGLVVLLNGWVIDFDALGLNHSTDL